MGIQILPSTGDSIAQGINQIAAGLDKYLNPNRDLQLVMQRTMASNPELLQSMADLESNAPGTMAKLGLGPLASIIGQVPQSAKGAAETATRPRAGQEAASRQSANISSSELAVSKNALDADKVKAAAKIMGADPSITFDAALRTLTGETAVEREDAKTTSKLKNAAAQNTLKTLERAGQIGDISQIDWRSKANDFINSRLSGSEAAAYFGNPDTARAFGEAIDVIKMERQIAAQKAMISLRGDNSVDNFRTQKAFQEYQKSGGVGTLQAWESFLFDPAMQMKAKQLMANPNSVSEADKDLLAIAKVTKTQIDVDKLGNVTLVNDKIANQLKKIENAATDLDRDLLITGLNDFLRQRAAIGGARLTAKYNDRGWLKSGRVEYRTPDGKLIDPSTVNATIADPYATDIFVSGPELSEVAQNALTIINGYKGDKRLALDKFKLADRSPNKQDSQAIEAELKRQGLIK